MNLLDQAVAMLESGGSSNNGPSGRYVNWRLQQFPAFARQYGSGTAGLLNYAHQVLAANPNATFGDMYGGYVTGTGNPATAREASLITTRQPGAQGAYYNLTHNSPVDPHTPLKNLLNDPAFSPQGTSPVSMPNIAPVAGLDTSGLARSQDISMLGGSDMGVAPQEIAPSDFGGHGGSNVPLGPLMTNPATLAQLGKGGSKGGSLMKLAQTPSVKAPSLTPMRSAANIQSAVVPTLQNFVEQYMKANAV